MPNGQRERPTKTVIYNVSLKDLIELNSAYPVWAKILFFACLIIAIAVVLFAKKTRVEESASMPGKESGTAKLTDWQKENHMWPRSLKSCVQ